MVQSLGIWHLTLTNSFQQARLVGSFFWLLTRQPFVNGPTLLTLPPSWSLALYSPDLGHNIGSKPHDPCDTTGFLWWFCFLELSPWLKLKLSDILTAWPSYQSWIAFAAWINYPFPLPRGHPLVVACWFPSPLDFYVLYGPCQTATKLQG